MNYNEKALVAELAKDALRFHANRVLHHEAHVASSRGYSAPEIVAAREYHQAQLEYHKERTGKLSALLQKVK